MSETTAKNNRKFIPLAIKRTLLLLLFALAVQMGISAEHQEGAVTRVSRFGGSLVRLRVYVDTTGNRMADTVLQFFDPEKDYVARNLESFIERGMRVTFDDNDYFIQDNMKFVGGSNTKTIDGDNMLVFFPNERERFKYAAAEYDRLRSQSNTGGSPDGTSMANLPPASPTLIFQKREREA